MPALERGQSPQAKVGSNLIQALLPRRQVVLADPGVAAALGLAAADHGRHRAGAVLVPQAHGDIGVEEAVGEGTDEQVVREAAQQGCPPLLVDHLRPAPRQHLLAKLGGQFLQPDVDPPNPAASGAGASAMGGSKVAHVEVGGRRLGQLHLPGESRGVVPT